MTIETVTATSDMDVDQVRSTIARAKVVGTVLLTTKTSVMPARATANTGPAELCTEAAAITNLPTGEAQAKPIATRVSETDHKAAAVTVVVATVAVDTAAAHVVKAAVRAAADPVASMAIAVCRRSMAARVMATSTAATMAADSNEAKDVTAIPSAVTHNARAIPAKAIVKPVAATATLAADGTVKDGNMVRIAIGMKILVTTKIVVDTRVKADTRAEADTKAADT
jgi:hypothetical protein